MLDQSDFNRLNLAAKSIELDCCEAFHTVSERYGKDVAGALVILYLRLQANPHGLLPTDGTSDRVAEVMRGAGVLR
jgi:hypothetical protein